MWLKLQYIELVLIMRQNQVYLIQSISLNSGLFRECTVKWQYLNWICAKYTPLHWAYANKRLKHTAKTQHRKFKTNIPRKGIARGQSQFPHSCVCERFMYSQDRSAYSAAEKYVETGTKAAKFLFWEHIMGFSLQCILSCNIHTSQASFRLY